MDFKIDTKEKFYVLTCNELDLTANMAEKIQSKVLKLRENKPNNVIVKFSDLQNIEFEAASILANCRMEMYDNKYSFVVCGLHDDIMEKISDWEMEDAINVTPTESEAWDIVQMDEIEREFLNGDEEA